ncbi:hypothetical protein M2282_006176 [Variovorax boronicumulans]|nr:hypothetical protein [Variovorax boronicumulans]
MTKVNARFSQICKAPAVKSVWSDALNSISGIHEMQLDSYRFACCDFIGVLRCAEFGPPDSRHTPSLMSYDKGGRVYWPVRCEDTVASYEKQHLQPKLLQPERLLSMGADPRVDRSRESRKRTSGYTKCTGLSLDLTAPIHANLCAPFSINHATSHHKGDPDRVSSLAPTRRMVSNELALVTGRSALLHSTRRLVRTKNLSRCLPPRRRCDR